MNKRTPAILALAVVAMVLALAAPTQAAWIAYHDFGDITSELSTGNITTHHTLAAYGLAPLDTSPKDLIKYSDGSDTGVDFSVAGANGADLRGDDGPDARFTPPAGGTDADALFNGVGLNLNNGSIYEGGGGGSGSTTYTLTGLNPSLLYDLAFYGDRSNSSRDGFERFTLGGADSATNSSSVDTHCVVVSPTVTDLQTRPNAAEGNVVRWTDIDPGADGIITINVDPEFHGNNSNIAYLMAMRLEEVPEPATMSLLVLGGLGVMLRRRRRA